MGMICSRQRLTNSVLHVSGLKKFIEAAQRDPEEDYDLVLKYCQSSNDCSEIFSLMEAEKRKQSEV